MSAKYEKDPAIAHFIEYLRIPSVHPDINYDECVAFLTKQANSLGLSVKVYEMVPKKPIVVMTWLGKDPKLPSVLLNSHMDVVPVFEKSWTHPPFSGYIDEEGKIFARGSQDMKCVGIQYLEAIRKLKQQGIQLKRTFHISFVPDEEIGGHDGMKKFVHSSEFKALNVGFALDEGMASPGEEFIIFNGERSIWQFHVHCTGQPGHGSLLIPNTAGEKIRYVIDKFMDLREEQKKILDSDPKLTIGDVTTINLTQVYGGVQSNVVPEKLTAVFDVRLAVTVDHDAFEKMVTEWCKEAGEGVTFDFEQKNSKVECTKTDSTNPYWVAFKSAADELKLKLDIRIFPGGTDSRYVRKVGIPAIGFSPMNHTPVLLHDHDEFLKADIFLKGIHTYVKLLSAGGVQSNVVPEKLTAVFDVRLAVTVDHDAFEKMVTEWCKEAGEGVTFDFEQKNSKVECTKTDSTNPYWVAFKSAADELKLKLDIRIFPGGTDSRYVRKVGIPAIGFSPMNHTPVLLHDHDEFLKADIFLKGIHTYVKLLSAGGVQSNVVPEKLTAVFDVRLAVTVDHDAFEKMVTEWCKEAGEGVTFDFEQKNSKVECTKTDSTNPYWVAFKSAADELKLKLDIRIFPGGTDSRYVRKVGIPAIGFSPMNHTPVLLHDHDEFLKADIFLKGIHTYVKLLSAVGNA